MSSEEVKKSFESFITHFDDKASDYLWNKQSEKFRKFWESKILMGYSNDLSDAEIDDIVLILDKNAKGSTPETKAVARMMIPQNIWRSLFRDLASNKILSSAVDSVFRSKTNEQKIAAINKLYELNKDNKNRLTGRSGNGISGLLAAYNPKEYTFMVSINTREKLIPFFGSSLPADFEDLTPGERIILSNQTLLNIFKNLGLAHSPRTTAEFCYSQSMKGLWSEDENEQEVETDESNEITEADFIKVLKKYSTPSLGFLLNTLDEILEHLKINKHDQRIVFSCRRKRLVLLIGQRYAFGLGTRGQNEVFYAISPTAIHPKSIKFEGSLTAYGSELTSLKEVMDNLGQIKTGCQNELERTERSGFMGGNNSFFEKAVFDKAYRNGILGKQNTLYSIEEVQKRFEEYLNKVIPRSVRNYLSAIPTISRISIGIGIIQKSLYEIQTPIDFDKFLMQLKDAEEYKENNRKGKNMYSAALSKYETFLEDLQNNDGMSVSQNKDRSMELNQILFGPPGTGKTYNAIANAVSIIEGVSLDHLGSDGRLLIKGRFDNYVRNGQIMFTTFHQSLSYEDFIEGIKPLTTDNDSIKYNVEPGLFMKVAARAAYNCYKEYGRSKNQSLSYTFDDLYDSFIAQTRIQINNEKPPTFKTLKGRDVEIKEINSNDSIIARAKNSIAKSSAPLTKENIQKLYDTFKTLDEIQDLSQVRDTVEVSPRITEFYAVFRGLKDYEKEFEKARRSEEEPLDEVGSTETIDVLEIQKKFSAGVFNEAVKKFGNIAAPIVLIIDEVNRGNVSQIFGELITLIEADKRLGNGESLEVTLPYSKSVFSVPSNLYIIGTMNTADRSVEALDTALRRRFSFVEMPPLYDLVELDIELGGVNLSELLKKINNRLEKLLSKDHLIGHSYFLSLSSPDDLKKSFQNKLIPLLQEYFYGDFGKIGLVLGQGFFEQEESSSTALNLFASFSDYEVTDLLDKPVYRLKNVSNMSDEEFSIALKLLINKAT